MGQPKVYGDTPRHTVNVDWDGTAVPAQWPERPTEFMPGFIRNMHRLHNAGIKLQIWTARINPYDPWTKQLRDPAYVAEEVLYIRNMLDASGLTFIDIWTREGKPGGSAYVDDKAERYTGRPGSWDAVTNKLLVRLLDEEPIFPAFDQEEVTA